MWASREAAGSTSRERGAVLMYDDIFFGFLCQYVFTGLGLLFAALAIIMTIMPAQSGWGEGVDAG
jgi:hypothetical protein